jgi:signal transduction histidine kinase
MVAAFPAGQGSSRTPEDAPVGPATPASSQHAPQTNRARPPATTRRIPIDEREAERRRIARDLHDVVGQALTAIKLSLEGMRSSPSGVPASLDLDDSIGLVEDAIVAVRSLAMDLRPAILDDLGLVPALRWLLDRHARQAGVQTRLAVGDLEDRPRSEVEVACYRVVEEALTNVARHARASRLDVEVRRSVGDLELTVEDNGVGFVVDEALAGVSAGRSFGLGGMRDRVALVGGTLHLESNPGCGTTLVVMVPRVFAPQVPSPETESRTDEGSTRATSVGQ